MGRHGKKKSAISSAKLGTRGKPEVEPVTQTAVTGTTVAQTIQQQRAAFAFKYVSELIDKEEAGRFRAYANSLPALVQMNGLGQAMAFACSKKSGKGIEARGWAALYKLASDWLCCEDRKIFDQDSTDLMTAIVSHDQNRYRLAQAECQALLVWVRQFAGALLKDDGRGEQK